MAHLSAVIVTFNQEKNIGRCLESIKDVADDIVVIDSGSTDRTQEICEQYPGVRFIFKEWLGHAEQKNYANKQARYDYVLSLEPDEELSDDLKRQILKVKPKLNGVYVFDRMTNYCGTWIKNSDWFPDPQKRIFPHGECKWSSSKSHEKLEVGNSTLKHRKLSGVLNHYSFYGIFDHLLRVNEYSEVEAKRIGKGKVSFLVAKAIINGSLRFFKAYFLKRGFLDGFHGFCVCSLSGFAVFLAYLKAAQINFLKHRGKYE